MKHFLLKLRSIVFMMTALGLVTAVVYMGYHEFFVSDVYLDEAFGCNITIEPSVLYKKSEIYEAITLIPDTDPTSYRHLCEYVTAIGPTDECGVSATACAHMGTRIGFARGNYGQLPDARNDIEALAALIVHETCHFHQGHTRKDFDISYDDEPATPIRESECDKKETMFLKALHSNSVVEHETEYGIYEDLL